MNDFIDDKNNESREVCNEGCGACGPKSNRCLWFGIVMLALAIVSFAWSWSKGFTYFQDSNEVWPVIFLLVSARYFYSYYKQRSRRSN